MPRFPMRIAKITFTLCTVKSMLIPLFTGCKKWESLLFRNKIHTNKQEEASKKPAMFGLLSFKLPPLQQALCLYVWIFVIVFPESRSSSEKYQNDLGIIQSLDRNLENSIYHQCFYLLIQRNSSAICLSKFIYFQHIHNLSECRRNLKKICSISTNLHTTWTKHATLLLYSEKYSNVKSNFLQFYQMTSAIPKHLFVSGKHINVDKGILNISKPVALGLNTEIDLCKMKCKDYYRLFIEGYYTCPTVFRKWSNYLLVTEPNLMSP